MSPPLFSSYLHSTRGPATPSSGATPPSALLSPVLPTREVTQVSQASHSPEPPLSHTMTGSLTSETLEGLESSEHHRLLNEIDQLRLQGIGDLVSLPQLIVCGDQSSGKSSVLEALSSINFPRRDNLCTRFPTEVILRRSQEETLKVKIIPSLERTEADRQKLLAFNRSLASFEGLPHLIDAATQAMGIGTKTSAFSKDVLRIEVSGPSKPSLTVVDLPGLIHSATKTQSESDVKIVSEMVNSYMKNPRTIILAVISAKNDYANQIVLKRAREADPERIRTFGIITKPDTLSKGSESEKDFIALSHNQDKEHQFRLGWHILKNRSFEARDTSLEYRNSDEANFFNQGVWKDIPKTCVGIASLRVRLGDVLLDQIKGQLPNLVKDIQQMISRCEDTLEQLGEARSTPEEQRLFLIKIGQSFSQICIAACNGNYDETFFANPLSEEGKARRLRARIQDLNKTFAENMRLRGHKFQICDTVNFFKTTNNSSPKWIDKKEAIAWAKKVLSSSRGRELPGTFNPVLIGELFQEQSMPWEGIAEHHLETVLDAVDEFLWEVMGALTDLEISERIFASCLDTIKEHISHAAKEKLGSLLTIRARHPITYNHYYTETIQKIKDQRHQQNMMTNFFPSASTTDGGQANQQTSIFSNAGNSADNGQPTQRPLFTSSAGTTAEGSGMPASKLFGNMKPSTPTEADMDDYACMELLDCMQAYYKVTSKTFIDVVAIQVVEEIIMDKLPAIFSPLAITNMDSDLINEISSESRGIQIEREQASQKLKVLRAGLQVCKRHARPESSVRARISKRKSTSGGAKAGGGASKQCMDTQKPEVPTMSVSATVESETTQFSTEIVKTTWKEDFCSAQGTKDMGIRYHQETIIGGGYEMYYNISMTFDHEISPEELRLADYAQGHRGTVLVSGQSLFLPFPSNSQCGSSLPSLDQGEGLFSRVTSSQPSQSSGSSFLPFGQAVISSQPPQSSMSPFSFGQAPLSEGRKRGFGENSLNSTPQSPAQSSSNVGTPIGNGSSKKQKQ